VLLGRSRAGARPLSDRAALFEAVDRGGAGFLVMATTGIAAARGPLGGVTLHVRSKANIPVLLCF
jgi:hypothetical protein